MTITIHKDGGVGVNVRYAIRRDGKRIASICRNCNDGFRVIWETYYFELKRFPNVAAALAAAPTLTYPTEQEVYETICAGRYQARKRVLEERLGATIVTLCRALIAGSNTARDELQRLFEMIECKARDHFDPELDGQYCYPAPPSCSGDEWRRTHACRTRADREEPSEALRAAVWKVPAKGEEDRS